MDEDKKIIIPAELEDAVNAFNDAMYRVAVSWSQGSKRVKLRENK